MRRVNRSLIAAAAVLLVGCATWSDWQKVDSKLGPIAGPGTKQSEVFHRCSRGNVVAQMYASSGGMCETAFLAADGTLVEMDALQQSIDAYLQTLSTFKAWPLENTGTYSYYRPPLRFYLLTFQPIVVLAVPETGTKFRSHCGGPMNGHTCVKIGR